MAALMIQGCGSGVGKSVLVAALGRLFTNRGLVVRPFKSQNMSNNAAVTSDGGEIGRAQYVQALACRTAPTVDMNPILLKPQSDTGAQLIVRGRRAGVLHARAHVSDKSALLDIAVESYRRLEASADLVIVEGAGSPAETNLREHDIANMGFASVVDVPVILVGDIDRGHVIAALVGAHTVLSVADRARIKGFIVNRFRGDATLFDAGLVTIAKYTGWPSIGMVPWLAAASRLPEEDAIKGSESHADRGAQRRVKIAVVLLPHIANSDDFDPLRQEPGVDLIFIPPGRPLPADAALVILPGTKSTLADLAFLRAQGWDIDLCAHARRGGRIIGICGGYQMLGRQIADPDGIEGTAGSAPGLGLLDVETVLSDEKTLRNVEGTVAGSASSRFTGYEIHLGVTRGPGTEQPFLRMNDGRSDGAISRDGRISGCYVHGLFTETPVRAFLLETLGAASSGIEHATHVDEALDEMAEALERALDIETLIRLSHTTERDRL